MINKTKILEFFTKDEIIEALMELTITNGIIIELVCARMNQLNKRADKIIEENNKILHRLKLKEDISAFIQAQKEMDANYQKFHELMCSNEALEKWLKDYQKEVNEVEDYV